jgi:hypothetical protein
MARERFRVVAQDAHFNGAETRFTHPSDSEGSLRSALAEHAPHLTIVRVEPLERALYSELHEARKGVQILPRKDSVFDYHELSLVIARHDLIEERLKSCCALAELLGVEAMENLANVLRRFGGNEGRFALVGLDSCAFSFSFAWGSDYRLNGGLIFHASSKQWSTHT